MTKSIDEYIRAFREADRRITPQRRLIFEILVEDVDHPAAEEVYRRALQTMPDLSRSTVYNTLNALVDFDVLDKVQDISDEGTCYDTETDDHHHLYCLRCGKLIDVYQDFEALTLSSDDDHGYQIVRRQVTFYGYCPECLLEGAE